MPRLPADTRLPQQLLLALAACTLVGLVLLLYAQTLSGDPPAPWQVAMVVAGHPGPPVWRRASSPPTRQPSLLDSDNDNGDGTNTGHGDSSNSDDDAAWASQRDRVQNDIAKVLEAVAPGRTFIVPPTRPPPPPPPTTRDVDATDNDKDNQPPGQSSSFSRRGTNESDVREALRRASGGDGGGGGGDRHHANDTTTSTVCARAEAVAATTQPARLFRLTEPQRRRWPPPELAEAPIPARASAPHWYSFYIETIAELQCAGPCQDRPFCHALALSVFNVLIVAKNAIAAVQPRLDRDGERRWQVEFPLPALSTTYEVHVRLHLFNFARAHLDVYNENVFFHELSTNSTARAAFPAAELNEPIVNSPVQLNVVHKGSGIMGHDDDFVTIVRNGHRYKTLAGTMTTLVHTRRSVAPCSEYLAKHRNSTLTGFWDAKFNFFYPYACRLLSLRQNPLNLGYENDNLINLSAAMPQQWLALYGNVHFPEILRSICLYLKAPVIYERVVKGRDRLHGCFAPDGQLLVTLNMWWGVSNLKSVQAALTRSALDTLEAMNVTQADVEKIAPWLVETNPLRPHYAIVTPGSLEMHRNQKRVRELEDLLMNDFSDLITPDRCNRLIVSTLTPVNSSIASEQRSFRELRFLVHNNVRFQDLNARLRSTFGHCIVPDLFTMALAPSLLGQSRDDLLLNPFIWQNMLDIILNALLAQRLNQPTPAPSSA